MTNMWGMFGGASSFNSDISNWNVGAVTSMEGMFWGASSFNSDISNWNVGRVTDMDSMFYGASSFNQNLCPWGPKLPSSFNFVSQTADMFSYSGCANMDSPTGPDVP